MDTYLEDFSIEDDGSLLILSRISDPDSEPPISENDRVEEWNADFFSHNNSGFAVMAEDKQGSLTEETRSYYPDDNQRGFNDFLDDEIDTEDFEDLALLGIQNILEKERANLEAIQNSNEKMKTMMSSPNGATSKKIAEKKNFDDWTSNKSRPTHADQFQEAEDVMPPNENTVPIKPYQKLFRRISNKFRRRRPANRYNGGSLNNPINMQTFIKDYYHSLNSVSRYIIFASILSFVTAFLLLSWYGAQTHSHDLEIFKLKENRFLMNQEMLEKYQLHHENRREVLIHQSYEERRECKFSLETCNSKQNELIAQISQTDKESVKMQAKLEAEIQVLKSELQDLRDQNRNLRNEIGQSFSSNYTQIFFSFLNIMRNQYVQIILGAGFTTLIFGVMFYTSVSK